MKDGKDRKDGKGLFEFERTYLERLRLAAQVIIDAATELDFVTDPLEVELVIFKERVELLLLAPGRPAADAPGPPSPPAAG